MIFEFDDASDPDSYCEPLEPPFRDPGGRSALRAGVRKYKCPTCGRKNMLTLADKQKGYQCDSCADAVERGGP